MLERFETVEESAVSSYKNRDGYSYTNDHSPLGIEQAIKKATLFVDYGGKITQFSDHIQVKWQTHSKGELAVYRIGKDTYFVHGWIEGG